MAGYFSVRLAEGVHDDLYAKALVIEQDGEKVALVTCDLVGIEESIVREARASAEKTTGIAGDRIMISATHSHTGPLLATRFLGSVEGQPLSISKNYLSALPDKIAESVRLADAGLSPARVWAGTGHEESLSFNRRYLMKNGTVGWNPGKLNPDIVQPIGPIDPEVPVVYLESPDKKPVATYVNYAMHLDTVGGTQFSADYAYTLSRLLGKIKGPEMLTLFTIGTAGNINHIDVKSRDPQKGHSEAQRIGTILAGEVLKTYAGLHRIATAAPRVRSEMVKLDMAPLQSGGDLAKAREVVAKFGKPSAPPFLDQVHAFKVLAIQERGGRPLEAEVQVMALGDELAWVGLPGEIFVELGIAIKKASPFRRTIVAELTNGSIGYVPNRKAYAEGAYEVISAQCAAGSGEVLVEAAIRLLSSLHKGKPQE